MKISPCVSVVIPAFNAADTIADALKSVLDQSLGGDKLELVLVNDGSTDETRSVSEAVLRKSDIPWRIIDLPNSGPSAARNAGVQVARSGWIQFLDADDLLAPNKLAVQVSNNPRDVAVIYSPWQMLRRHDGEWRPDGTIKQPSIVGDPTLALLKAGNFVAMGSQLFRRTWLRRVRGFNEQRRFIEDVELLLRIAMAGGKFLRADSEAPLLFYRVHEDSLSHTSRRGFVDGCVDNAKMVEAYWREKSQLLSQEQSRLLTEIYGQGARFYYEHSQAQFRQIYDRLLTIDTKYLPSSPKPLRALSRLLGYPRAEALALAYHNVKSRFLKSRLATIPSSGNERNQQSAQ